MYHLDCSASTAPPQHSSFACDSLLSSPGQPIPHALSLPFDLTALQFHRRRPSLPPFASPLLPSSPQSSSPPSPPLPVSALSHFSSSTPPAPTLILLSSSLAHLTTPIPCPHAPSLQLSLPLPSLPFPLHHLLPLPPLPSLPPPPPPPPPSHSPSITSSPSPAPPPPPPRHPLPPLRRGAPHERPLPVLDAPAFPSASRPCGAPSCSALSNISLLLTAAGRAPCAHCAAALRRTPRAACLCVREWTRLALEQPAAGNVSYSALRHLRYAAALRRAAALPRTGAAGVLLAHFDFFLNVRRFHAAAYAEPWMARNGAVVLSDYDLPEPRCFRVGTAPFRDNRSWFWFDHAKPRGAAAVRALGGAECCWEWADILYLPRAMLDDFARLVRAFGSVHHEVAVPTSMRMLALRRNVTLCTLACVGGAIGRMPNFDPKPASREVSCSHRMNLSNASASS